jgi:hypothetical protein
MHLGQCQIIPLWPMSQAWYRKLRGFDSCPGHVTDPYAPELAQPDSSPSFPLLATYDRDGNELTAEVTSA